MKLIESLLKEIDNKKAILDTHRPFTKEQIRNIKRVYDVDFTYNSNAIEGSTLTYSETKLVLNEGLTIGGKRVNEHLEAINHKEAIDFIEEISNTNSITIRDIKDIHSLVLKGINTKYAGVYRDKPVGVQKSDGTIKDFCEPLKIDESMNFFIEELNKSKLHPILKATKVHFDFVTIHPFIDGNGRTARLLMNLILLQKGYPPAIIRVENRVSYILSIEKAQENGDLNDFYIVVLNALNQSLDNYLKMLNMKMI